MKQSYSDEDDYLDDLRAERDYYRRRDAALRQAPDCRDPAHDGCERCYKSTKTAAIVAGLKKLEGEE